MTRHRFDFLSFFFGAIFTLAGVAYALQENPWNFVFDLSLGFRWVGPILLLVVGLALVRPVFRSRPTDPGMAPADPLEPLEEAAMSELPESPLE